MTLYARFDTTLGPMYATAEGDALTGIYFEGARWAPALDAQWREAPDHPVLRDCARQLHDYFAGTREAFDLPLAIHGTAFQANVWREIAAIPFGQTVTYAALAQRAGSDAAVRAAGAATGRNPFTIVVPCHRVVGSGGALTGYAGGLERKRSLLALERAAR